MSGAIMRFLIAMSVLICSMHIAEPAAAHTADDENGIHLIAEHSDEDSSDAGSTLVHSGHHHCPVAPDLRQTANDRTPLSAGGMLFAAIVARLTSRAPPPLLDPPLA